MKITIPALTKNGYNGRFFIPKVTFTPIAAYFYFEIFH